MLHKPYKFYCRTWCRLWITGIEVKGRTDYSDMSSLVTIKVITSGSILRLTTAEILPFIEKNWVVADNSIGLDAQTFGYCCPSDIECFNVPWSDLSVFMSVDIEPSAGSSDDRAARVKALKRCYGWCRDLPDIIQPGRATAGS